MGIVTSSLMKPKTDDRPRKSAVCAMLARYMILHNSPDRVKEPNTCRTLKNPVTGIVANRNGRIFCTVYEDGSLCLLDEGLLVLQRWGPTENGPLLDIELCRDFSCLVLAACGSVGHLDLKKNELEKRWISTIETSTKVPPPVFSTGFYSQDGQSFFLSGGASLGGKFSANLWTTDGHKISEVLGNLKKPVRGM